jgi:hypothetical protein
MKAEERTILEETLTKVFKMSTEQLSTLFNQDGDLTDMTAFVESDEKRVQKWQSEKLQQLNRGIKEGAGKIEKEVKEKYSIESDLIGSELIDFLVQQQVAEASKNGAKDVTKHPDYIKLEAGVQKQLKDRDREWQTKLEERERQFSKDKLFEKIKDKALASLDARKPMLPADPKKALVWKETYLNELRQGNYQEGEDGTPIVLDKEGNVMKDSHGNAITFDEYEKQIADKYFEYPVSQPRSSTGNNQPITTGNGDVKTKADALARLKDPKITPTDRIKFTELFETLKD